MNDRAFNSATHFSIVWGVTLAVVTLVEWHSLDREPMRPQIYSPFIDRVISIDMGTPPTAAEAVFDTGPAVRKTPPGDVRYEVEFRFDGPLFAASFFIPVLLFHGLGALLKKLTDRGET